MLFRSTGTKTTTTPANTTGMLMGAGMAGLGLATGNPMMMASGLGGAAGAANGGASSFSVGNGGSSGSPFFGLFGNNIYSQPGSASNGGWSTTASRPGLFGG